MNARAQLTLPLLYTLLAGCPEPETRFEDLTGGVTRGEELIGGACEKNLDCTTGACLPPEEGYPGGYCFAPCDATGCPIGSVCVPDFVGGDGLAGCLELCMSGVACHREGYACLPAAQMQESTRTLEVLAEVCAPVLGARIGAACAENEDCARGRCLTEGEGFAGGYCTAVCETAGDLCQGVGICSDLEGESVCYLNCRGDSDCGRPGYRCKTPEGGDTQVCLPFEGLPVGDACTDGDECEHGFCATEEDGFPDGACTAFCAGEVCPAGTACDFFPSVGAVCMPTCTGGACRAGYACGSSFVTTSSVCRPVQ